MVPAKNYFLALQPSPSKVLALIHNASKERMGGNVHTIMGGGVRKMFPVLSELQLRHQITFIYLIFIFLKHLMNYEFTLKSVKAGCSFGKKWDKNGLSFSLGRLTYQQQMFILYLSSLFSLPTNSI